MVRARGLDFCPCWPEALRVAGNSRSVASLLTDSGLAAAWGGGKGDIEMDEIVAEWA